MFEECFGEGPFIFRLNDSGSGPQLLTQVCLERGWKEYNSQNSDQWNLWWKTSGFPTGHHRSLYAWQYINHIPKGSTICRKDNLARYLKCMKKIYGSIYDFSPTGFNLPLEYTKLAAECSRSRPISSSDEEGYRHIEDRPVWICKPVGQSQGKGIFLFRKLSELTYDSNTIVQRYIERPLLIGGYKFDLRLYVFIPSYHPLTVYMYKEGLARFGTDKFTLNDLRNPFRHLTNSSINKLGPGYGEMKERIGSGCKWTLKRLRRYFQQAGISDWLLWQRVSAIVILTIISNAGQVPQTANCFEFFGFDVLIDNKLKPWLLEVNVGPALANDCDADRIVKKPMLHDMFDLLGLPLYNTGLSVFNIWNEEKHDPSSYDEEEGNVCDVGKPSTRVKVSALSAAAKWRKRSSKKYCTSATRSAVNCRKNNRFLSATGCDSLPKISLRCQTDTLHRKHDTDTDLNTNSSYFKDKRFSGRWGNGKDWKNAQTHEGGWIRVWPMRDHGAGSENIKCMINQVSKFSKTSKLVARNNPNGTECEMSKTLQREMGITSEIWIPPK